MKAPQAVVFDMYGTLVDVEAVADACRRVAPDPEAFGATWRRKQLEYSFLMTSLGRYLTFWELSKRALDYAAGEAGIQLSDTGKKKLMEAWLKPTPYPDTAASLKRLSTVCRLAILSNGNPRMLREGLAHTGLKDKFESVLSADAVRAFKPSPAVYQHASDRMGLAPAEILFVSSNGFDVVGAGRFGFRVCWVNRRGGTLDPLGVRPAVEVGTLSELADRFE